MTSNKYREVIDEIDAREVLRYLNELGIHNISGEVLKDFITDLKKVIKYDLYHGSNKENRNITSNEVRGPERLHSMSTFCSRSRAKTCDNNITQKCKRECGERRFHNGIRNIVSVPLLNKHESKQPSRRACSCPQMTIRPDSAPLSKRRPSSSNNLIRVPIQPPQKKCDPVSLYHYYLSMWEKYKANVPGENSWSELRWSIRQKIAGDVERKKTVKTKVAKSLEDLERREKGWME